MAQNNSRDEVRSKLFSGAQSNRKTETINMFGTQVEVRQPSVGQVLELQGSDDQRSQLVRMMIEYCYVPGTDEKVFEPADEEAIMNWPVGDWFNQFNNAVMRLTDINVEAAAKN